MPNRAEADGYVPRITNMAHSPRWLSKFLEKTRTNSARWPFLSLEPRLASRTGQSEFLGQSGTSFQRIGSAGDPAEPL
jgi:hypothetical protein